MVSRRSMPSSDMASNAMFHTFQGLALPRHLTEPQDTPRVSTNGRNKRVTTAHACAECKRRKIKCDGKQPCGPCAGCRVPKPCYYDKHRERVIPSRKTLDDLQNSLDECRMILNRLFPDHDPQSLLSLSRDDLISLITSTGSAEVYGQQSPAVSHTSITQDYEPPLTHSSSSLDDRNLASLELIPARDTEYDEERRNREPIPAECDDVNALSMSVDRQSSYLGVSSIKAAFITMLKASPALRSYLESNSAGGYTPERSIFPKPKSAISHFGPPRISWSSEGQTFIDAYFNRVQIFIPMLDEPSFRANFLNGQRNDGPWLALLNMVFAMGSIAGNKSDDNTHQAFYTKAKDYLTIDAFGSGHLETLQALILMGGFYLHYINKPNMANAVTGAALRMACALGLHRECPNSNNAGAEIRRRTWWSLFCLDTWASTPMGRPSFGRIGPSITIRPPEGLNNVNENATTSQHIRVIPLIENIKFCKLATSVQDTLAVSPLPWAEDRVRLDNKLVKWFENLPCILKSKDPCSEALYTARCVMKWRYQNLRIILHRPFLLHRAYGGLQSTPSSDDLTAIKTCRALAKQTIYEITSEFSQNQMSGWNAVWFLYQASMIPLVSIFSETWNTVEYEDWCGQIEAVLEGLTAMADWSLSARRSREVVAKMYEASKGSVMWQRGLGEKGGYCSRDDSNASAEDILPFPHSRAADPNQEPNLIGGDRILHNRSSWDLDGMLWGCLPNNVDTPFDEAPDMDFVVPGSEFTYGNDQ